MGLAGQPVEHPLRDLRGLPGHQAQVRDAGGAGEIGQIEETSVTAWLASTLLTVTT